MKYIVQLFQEYDNAVDRDSHLMFQVIFSAKSIKEARKVSGSVFRKWKKEQEDDYGLMAGHTYKKQTFLLKDFIKMKEQQFKVCFA
jgi:hypothetical protein